MHIDELQLTPDIVSRQRQGRGDASTGAVTGWLAITLAQGWRGARRAAASASPAATLDDRRPHPGGAERRPSRRPLLDARQPEPDRRDGRRCFGRAANSSTQVESYFGLRSVGIANGRFLLNDRPIFLRSVLEQGYWPKSHLAAPSADALKQEVELIKSLGFNAVRIHQKIEDPRFLYWADSSA